MNILIVCATQFEVKPLLDFLEVKRPVEGMNLPVKQFGENEVSVLITGVGMVNTAYGMGLSAVHNFGLALNVGICGAFDRSIALGEVVHVTEDILSELGAEDGEAFLTYDQLNLPGEHIFSNHLPEHFRKIDTLKQVKGITVNTVHGNDPSIEKVKQLYNPDVESMEGAAFYASCKRVQGNFTQIRAASNYVEKRDRSAWQMPLAIKHLNDFLVELIETPLIPIP